MVFWSTDLLGNEEDPYNEETYNLDCEGPEIVIHNPTKFETHKIRRCDQSVVVEIWDDKSGISASLTSKVVSSLVTTGFSVGGVSSSIISPVPVSTTIFS